MLIFLDIDGVMVPVKSWKAPELLQDGFPAFSKKAIIVLQQLIAEGGTVMLTSSHKHNYSIQQWKQIFERRGIILNDLQTLDPNIMHLNRREEIVRWVNMNDLEDDNFVILDDDRSLNDLPEFLKQKLVLTSSQIGLTEEHLQLARRVAAIPLELV